MSEHKKVVTVFPGTFDPVTNGHLDVIERGRALFDELIVAIARNPVKSELFTVPERLDVLRELTNAMPNVQVEAFDGLTVDYVRRMGASAILRGLRNLSDMEFEFQLALTNRTVAGIETVFIMTSEQYGFTSSSLIKEVAMLGGDVSRLVPPLVVRRVREKFQSLGPAERTQPGDPDGNHSPRGESEISNQQFRTGPVDPPELGA